jgi:hypothetical protein
MTCITQVTSEVSPLTFHHQRHHEQPSHGGVGSITANLFPPYTPFYSFLSKKGKNLLPIRKKQVSLRRKTSTKDCNT